jgi:hypothetical protein
MKEGRGLSSSTSAFFATLIFSVLTEVLLRSFYEHMWFDLQSFCKLADGPHLRLYAISLYAINRRRSDPGFLGQLDLTERGSEPQPFEILPYVHRPWHGRSPFTVRIVVCTDYIS